MAIYWFKPTKYGYGATPANWKGWAATFAMAAILLVSIWGMDQLAGRSNLAGWLIWAAVVAAISLSFVELSRRKTDGQWRWRWDAHDKH
jgi:amino acid transporter